MVWQINAPTTVNFPPNTLMKVGESKDDTMQVLYKHASDFTPRPASMFKLLCKA
jgi:hypothetical protein